MSYYRFYVFYIGFFCFVFLLLFCSFLLFFFCLENNLVLNNSLMVSQKLSIANRWHIIGMNNVGLSRREIVRQLGLYHTVRKYQQQTIDVKNTNRPGHCLKTSPGEDRMLLRLVRRCPFSSSMILRDTWILNRAISTRTV